MRGPQGAVGPQGLAIEADILFNTTSAVSSGIVHTAGTSTITVASAGTYEVEWMVSGAEPNQFALFVNGVESTGTLYGSGAGTQQNGGQVILTLAAADIVTLRNHSSAAAVTLQTLAGGTQTNVNASILIKKLS